MEAILARVESFSRTGRGDIRKLSGRADEWRLRAGRWRVLMVKRVDGSYLIEGIDDRRDAYT
ncbi:MAG: type II toxin-antitoxin system RelE family toxin [Dehalococcoidia bacterium]